MHIVIRWKQLPIFRVLRFTVLTDLCLPSGRRRRNQADAEAPLIRVKGAGRAVRAAALLGLVLCGSIAGWAQGQPARPQAAGAGKRKLGPVNIFGSWRVRLEGWNWFEGTSGNSDYAFPHSLFRLSLGQERERIDWQLEGTQDSILGLPSDAVVGAPQGQLGLGGSYFAANGNRENNASGFIKQAFVRFKRPGKGSLRIGRFEYIDGTELPPKDPTLAALVQTRIAQRLIGNFGWSAVGRSYDGAHFLYNFGTANLTLLGGRPTRGVFQTDGMGELDAEVYYGALTTPVAAARGAGHFRLFGLGYVDHRRSVLKTDNRPQAARAADRGQIRLATFGANYLHVFNTQKHGQFNVVLWGAVQTGAWGLLTQRAGAFVGEFGWQLPVKAWKPWWSVGYSYGSGDGDPNDDRHGTYFQVLPTPRPYARFPFYNMENNQDFLAALNFRPHAKLAVRSEIHALRLSERNDLWYVGGGVFQPRTFGYVGRSTSGNRSLANVWDISADCQVTRDFAVTFYYAHAWGKAAIARIYPQDRNGQFAYVETNFRF